MDRARTAMAALGRLIHDVAVEPAYAELGSYPARLRVLPETSEEAGRFHSELESRQPALRAELDGVQVQRDLVAQRLYQSVGDAYRDIGRAERASVLPAGLEGWDGLPFLQIGYETPRNREEWVGVCEQVVEDFSHRKDDLLGGMNLLLEGVRRANRRGHFTATMLQPDAILTAQRYPVENLKLSEGQELTAAVVLYCTFVNLRVQNRGRAGGASRATGVSGSLFSTTRSARPRWAS